VDVREIDFADMTFFQGRSGSPSRIVKEFEGGSVHSVAAIDSE